MAYEVALDEAAGLIRVRYYGVVELHDLRGAIHSVLALVREPPLRRTLSDFRDVASWRPMTAELRAIGRELDGEAPRAHVERSAYVATRDDVYGDLRAWVGVTQRLPYPREVFRDMAVAERWLETGELEV